METFELSSLPLFRGLDTAALAAIAGEMQPRRFAAGEFLCHQGEQGDSLFAIQRGLARVIIEPADRSEPAILARLRRGDVVGEISLITGDPRSASVIASIPTDTLELGREAFARILARHPAIVSNLSRILSQRLVRANMQQFEQRNRGEAVALIVGARAAPLAAAIVEAARSASPRELVSFRLATQQSGSAIGQVAATPNGTLAALADLPSPRTTVIAVAGVDQPDLAPLLEHADRAVVVANEHEVRSLNAVIAPVAESVDVVLVGEHDVERAKLAPRTVGGLRVLRTLDTARPAAGVAWLGRHLARTKLGLALGAGGAKGYAHVGALQVLEEAGYTVDYIAGSSIGALVGAWLALGLDASQVERTMREAFTPEAIAAIFKLSLSGTSSGLESMIRLCRETTKDLGFTDLQIPLTVMAVDLNTRAPAPITAGPLWEALLAATALAGLFPPYEREGQRLVDGLALVPVPVASAAAAGADLTVSVNILSRETLSAWPGESPPEPPAARGGARMLDTLLEVMDLAQLDASVRSAGLADVVITPRFGPASWKDFHLADRFLAAGRVAAEAQLPTLRNLAKPQGRLNYSTNNTNKGVLHGTTAVHL